MQIKDEITYLSTKLSKRIDFVKKEIKTMPSGTLRFQKQNKKTVAVYETYISGQRQRKTVQKDPALISKLLKKQLLEEELAVLKNNYEQIRKTIAQLKDFDRGKMIYDFKTAYPELTDAQIEAILSPGEKNEWANCDYERLNYKSEEKIHITSRGLRVRSKSELLIAEKLYEYEIPFRYEQLVHINGATLSPDFTILRDDNKIFYWEHQGLTNSQEYINWQKHKAQMYAAAEIVPWDNLIISYDNAHGDIDLRIIESEIKNKLVL